MKIVKLFIIQIILIGCTAKSIQDPESVLKEYVNYRFSNHQTRTALLNFTTASLYQSIEAMSENDFSKFKNTQEYRRKKFKINLKKCTATQCHITYTVVYDIVKKGGPQYSVEVKKIAELHNTPNSWKIASVSNVKTFFDSKTAIEL